jgi:regulation of enolase protein 1 (concanavalin A-like superfamily)
MLGAFGGLVAGRVANAADGYTTNTIQFSTYTNRTSLIAGGWSFWATNAIGAGRNTEITNANDGAMLVYTPSNNPSALRIPADEGFLFTTQNDSRNCLFRTLPANWVSMRMQMAFHPYQSFQEANLMVYEHDDSFVWLGHSFSGNERVRFGREFTGLLLENSYDVTVLAAPATNVTLRLDRDAETDRITGYYSLDQTNWHAVGNFSQSFSNPRLGIYVGGSPGGFPDCDLLRLDVVTRDNPVTPTFVTASRHIVFNTLEGQVNTNMQAQFVGLRSEQSAPANWTLTNSMPAWLVSSITNGTTPTEFDVSLAPAITNLAVGTYTAMLGFRAAGVPALDVPVTLIINPSNAVRVTTWLNGRQGAMTVSVDDSKTSGYFELVTNGYAGSFMLMQEYQPPVFTELYQTGMELGAHSVTHPCTALGPATIRGELERNVLGIIQSTPMPEAHLVSLAWPCGVATVPYRIVASEYFLCARGYNINQLEDPTPRDFMNLKSYNSHEFAPFPPADLKTVVDAAEAQGKWFNLVLHNFTTDDGAIAYSAGKNVWVSSLGAVSKYIYQRDRTVLTNYENSAEQIKFDTYRLPIEASLMRSFETAFTTNDVLTFQVDLLENTNVSAVFFGGKQIPFGTNSGMLQFSALVSTNAQLVVVDLTSNSPPVLPSQANRIITESSGLIVTNAATDADLPAQTLTYAVTVTNMTNGILVTNIQINAQGVITWISDESNGPGNYYVTTTVTDFATPPLSATNGFMVTVNELNQAPVLLSQANRSLIGITTLTVTNAATDADVPANTLSYALFVTNLGNNTLVANASINSAGIITWTPTEAQLGTTNRLTTIVTDYSPLAFNSQNLSATNSFVVIAYPDPLVLPVQTNRSINELSSLEVTNQGIVVIPDLMGGWLTTNTVAFNYTNRATFLAEGWSFVATHPNGTPRDTEVTNPVVGLVGYAQTNVALGTVMRVPCDTGDMWMGLNNTTNSIFRDLPTNWVSARLRISFAAVQNYMQTYLMLYQDDDNYLQVGRGFISGERMEFIQEVAGEPAVLASPGVSGNEVTLRLDRNPATQAITAYYSLNNTDWTSLGTANHSLTNARLGIWTGASGSPYASTQFHADYSRLDVITTNTALVLNYSLAVTNTANQLPVTNAVIDAAGAISWIPTEAQGPGVYSFATTVTDGSFSAWNIFYVTVNEVNLAPSLTLPADAFIFALSNWTAQATASDSDLPVNDLTFELVAGPAGMTVSPSGGISWTPSVLQSNTINTVTIRVVDDNPPAVNATSLSSTGSFTVAVAPVLIVTANDASRSYTSQNPEFSASFSGFVNGDDTNDLGGSLTFTTTATNGSPVGVYPINLSGVTSTNYTIVFASGQLTITPSGGVVSLGDLAAVYDGSAKSASVTTVPANLLVNLTYSGSVNAPTNVGSYEVIGTISDLNYAGSATNTLVIAPSNAVVTLADLNQVYNGTARIVTATTVPSSLNVVVTYNGSISAPTNAGSYEVIGTISDLNYAGSATNTLTVVVPDPIVVSLSVDTPGTVVVSWNSVPGQVYRVQYKNDLQEVSWINLPPDITAIGPMTSVTNVIGSEPHRFFRVGTLP